MQEKLPQHIFDRLSSSAYSDKLDSTIKRFSLNTQKLKALVEAGGLVIQKINKPEELPELIENALQVEKSVAHDIALEYIGLQLLPVQDYIGDVTGLITQMGGDVSFFQKQAANVLLPEQVWFENFAYITGEADIKTQDITELQRKNLFTIFLSVLNETLNTEQTFGMVTQPPESGGLGLSNEQGELVALSINKTIEDEEITLADFAALDEARKSILGDHYTSILTTAISSDAEETSYTLEKLKDSYHAFMQNPEVGSFMQAIGSADTNVDAVKGQLYDSIKEQDKQKFIVALGVLFASGKLKQAFKQDARYIAFWRPKVLKAEGLDIIRVFDENPARPKYLGAFVKFVLEKRFEMSEEESVMWGVYFASAAHHAGDYEYEHLAYGDTKTGTFVWSV